MTFEIYLIPSYEILINLFFFYLVYLEAGCSYAHIEEETNRPSSEYLMLRRRNKSAVPIVSQSEKCMSQTLDKKEEERLENEILLKYLYAVGKRTTGLQSSNVNRRPPREFLSSYNINHPEFSKGQKLFLNELCSMYSVAPLKESKQQQYIKLFKKQTDGGFYIDFFSFFKL